VLSLSGIDADSLTPGDQAFRFLSVLEIVTNPIRLPGDIVQVPGTDILTLLLFTDASNTPTGEITFVSPVSTTTDDVLL